MTTVTATSELARKLKTALKRTLGAVLLSSFLQLAPIPASRPRVSRWGVYYSKNYTDWQKEAERLMADLNAQYSDKPVVLFLEHIVPAPKTKSKSGFPRGDIDNYSKAPMDALTKVGKLWKDDTQVVGLVAFKRFAEPNEEPGTVIEAFPLTQEENT